MADGAGSATQVSPPSTTQVSPPSTTQVSPPSTDEPKAAETKTSSVQPKVCSGNANLYEFTKEELQIMDRLSKEENKILADIHTLDTKFGIHYNNSLLFLNADSENDRDLKSEDDPELKKAWKKASHNTRSRIYNLINGFTNREIISGHIYGALVDKFQTELTGCLDKDGNIFNIIKIKNDMIFEYGNDKVAKDALDIVTLRIIRKQPSNLQAELLLDDALNQNDMLKFSFRYSDSDQTAKAAMKGSDKFKKIIKDKALSYFPKGKLTDKELKDIGKKILHALDNPNTLKDGPFSDFHLWYHNDIKYAIQAAVVDIAGLSP